MPDALEKTGLPSGTFREPPSTDGRRNAVSVWIADDSPLQLEAARRALAEHCNVSVYANGLTLLEDLTSGLTPDVLLLDWQMPDLTGLEVCRFVRSTRDLAQLPILVLTSKGADDMAVEALAAGANDFLRIPFSPAELSARISALVEVASLYAGLAEAEGRLRVEADFRERFMGMLAHDLRQPLHTILLANRAAAQAESDAALREQSLEMQLRAVERMQRMIGELLDFTRNRPESGLPIQRVWTDFAGVVGTSVSEMRLAHPARVLEVRGDAVCEGRWDRDRIAQLCGNLLGNAIEHSAPHSRIEVTLTCTTSHVQLCVANQGPPIPEQALPTLFQPFRRGIGERSSSGSLGLGLYIVEQIVRAHSGSVAVQSGETRTEFVVRLPREMGPALSSTAPSSGYARRG